MHAWNSAASSGKCAYSVGRETPASRATADRLVFAGPTVEWSTTAASTIRRRVSPARHAADHVHHRHVRGDRRRGLPRRDRDGGDQGGPPKHVHPQQREIYAVEEGELTVTLDGDRHVVPAGESIEIPADSVHGFAKPSDQPVRFTADHLPALRFEEYIRLVHRTVQGRKATLPVIMRVVRIESSYPETILPPPGPPRLVGKVLAGLGRLAGYPTGEELTASS